MVKTIRIYKIPIISNWSLYIKNTSQLEVAIVQQLEWQELNPFVYTARIENIEIDTDLKLNSFAYCSLDTLFGSYSMSLISNRIWQITVDCRVSYLYNALQDLKGSVSTWNLDLIDSDNALSIPKNIKPFGELPTNSTPYNFNPDHWDTLPVIKWLLCQFIPSSDSKINIADQSFEGINSNYITHQGTFVVMYPLFSDNDNGFLWNDQTVIIGTETRTLPALTRILKSAQLKSATLCPFSTSYATITGDTIYYNASYFDVMVATTGVAPEYKYFLPIAKDWGPKFTLNKIDLGSLLFSPIEVLHRQSRYDFNFFGAKIVITYEDIQQYFNMNITDLEVWVDLAGSDLLICWYDYNGVMNRVPCNNSLPLIIDSWQQYVAQNQNYRDTLFHVPTEMAVNQYILATQTNNNNFLYNQTSELTDFLGDGLTGLLSKPAKFANAFIEKDMIDINNKNELKMNAKNIKLQAQATIAQMRGGPNQVQYSQTQMTAAGLRGNANYYFGYNKVNVLPYYEDMVDRLLRQNGVEVVGSITKDQFKAIINQLSFKISINNQQLQLFKYQGFLTSLSQQQLFYCNDAQEYQVQIEKLYN